MSDLLKKSVTNINSETTPLIKLPQQDTTMAAKLASTFQGPLIVYGLLAGLYTGTYKTGGWNWFSWHPFCMVIGFVALAGNATLLKKVGGYQNTKYHGYLMFLATLVAGFGWYVIYDLKETNKKVHLASNHGLLGAIVLVGYTALAIFGAVTLNPDWGYLKTNQTVRLAHKWTGRLLTMMAWTACVTGYMGMEREFMYQALFGLPLLFCGFYVLL